MRAQSLRLIGFSSLLTLVAATFAVVLGFEQAPQRLMVFSALGLLVLPLVVLARAASTPASRRKRVVLRSLLSRRAPHALSVYLRLLAAP